MSDIDPLPEDALRITITPYMLRAMADAGMALVLLRADMVRIEPTGGPSE